MRTAPRIAPGGRLHIVYLTRGTEARSCEWWSADDLDVLRGGSLLTLHHVELDLRTFREGAEAAPLDRGKVDEAVLRAILRGDEPEALRVVEPLHSALGTHSQLPG